MTPRLERLVSFAFLVAIASACGSSGDTPSLRIEPTRLGFAVAPQDVREGKPFGNTVEVAVLDERGDLVRSATPTIRLQLEGSAAAQLTGGLESVAVAGVARFPDLRFDGFASGLRLRATATDVSEARSDPFDVAPGPRFAILFIADGWGYKHIEATRAYTGKAAGYESWDSLAMATWDLDTERGNSGRGYDPARAWGDFAWAVRAATDSASSATAMYTGQKTDTGNISVAAQDAARLETLAELAASRGIASGAVTSVPITHATPGAWCAHNSSRGNTLAIGDECAFGHPNTTGDAAADPRYGGHWGATRRDPTRPGFDVMLGGGHPDFNLFGYVNATQLKKLRDESGKTGAWTLVERIRGREDAGARLLDAASDPRVTRLFGLFGGESGNLDYRLADGSGRNRENPTLAEMTAAALRALSRKPDGFALMVEGGAIDWAGHANQLDPMIGEMVDFNDAFAAVVRWVDDSTNDSNWKNTTIIVTGDHECGYLTQAPGVFPNVPLGEISARTLALEKPVGLALGLRASWDDANQNGEIDGGETVHWAWNSAGHSNTLIPLFARGAATSTLSRHVIGTDPVRGKWIDNTSVYSILKAALRL